MHLEDGVTGILAEVLIVESFLQRWRRYTMTKARDLPIYARGYLFGVQGIYKVRFLVMIRGKA